MSENLKAYYVSITYSLRAPGGLGWDLLNPSSCASHFSRKSGRDIAIYDNVVTFLKV